VRRKRTVGSSSLVVPPARAQAPLLIIPGYEELDPRELEYLIEAFEERREERRREMAMREGDANSARRSRDLRRIASATWSQAGLSKRDSWIPAMNRKRVFFEISPISRRNERSR